MTNLKGKERITGARISLQSSFPYWGYISMHLNPIETDKVPSMGVDVFGNLYYNPTWINSLPMGELKGVIAHEIMHLILDHAKEGQKTQNHEMYNIAIDLKVNDILVENGFKLPKEGIIPQNHTYNFGAFKIKDIDKKSSIELYYELKKHAKTITYTMMDSHEMLKKNGDDKKGKKGQSGMPSDLEGKFKDWKSIALQAKQYAKQRGKLPAGMEKFFDELETPSLDWKSLLWRYITSMINSDYTFLRRNKKYSSIYLPGMEKDNAIDIIVTLDTSGSMWGKDDSGRDILKLCLSEIAGIARSFNQVNMLLITGDAEVKDVYDMRDTSEKDILNVRIKGAGGTSHKPFYRWIKENKPDTKLVINLTDGWTDFPSNPIGDTLWVCPPYHAKEEEFPFGKVIVIRNGRKR